MQQTDRQTDRGNPRATTLKRLIGHQEGFVRGEDAVETEMFHVQLLLLLFGPSKKRG